MCGASDRANANPSTFGARTHECINLIWRTAACCAWSQLSVLRKRHIKVLRLHDFNRGDLRVRCLGSRNANPSTFGARTHECINLIWRTAACCAWSQLSVFRKRHIKVLRLHDFNRGDLRVRCLGSRNANPSTFGARTHECINLIWRDRCVLRVVSAFGFQKKAYQSFVTSRLQSRRFACALSRIAQRKSINIRSAQSRVHKSTLANRKLRPRAARSGPPKWIYALVSVRSEC